jgi:hypothetical protein
MTPSSSERVRIRSGETAERYRPADNTGFIVAVHAELPDEHACSYLLHQSGTKFRGRDIT